MTDTVQSGEPGTAAAGPSYPRMGCGCLAIVLGGLIGFIGTWVIAALFPPPGETWLLLLPTALGGAPLVVAGCYLLVTPWRLWTITRPAGPIEKDGRSSGS